jgi:hypothetical protein
MRWWLGITDVRVRALIQLVRKEIVHQPADNRMSVQQGIRFEVRSVIATLSERVRLN